MSFDYDKIAHKSSEDHGSWWTSYADLFMMLSIVFLLMYVASSLRNGSAGFQQQTEFKKLAQKAESLEQQIKVYNTLKDETLRKQSSQDEQEVYKKLMSKLDLLQEEARDEKNALRKKAKENEEKEFALNQYQQVVRNIINANVLAKAQIKHRDDVIVTKDATIEEKKEDIAQLERVKEQNEAQINNINHQLANKIQALRVQQKLSRTSKKIMEQKIAQLRNDSLNKIQSLEEKNQNIEHKLNEVNSTLAQTESNLAQTQTQLQSAHVTAQQATAAAQQANAAAEEAAAAAAAAESAAQQKEAERNALAAKIRADQAKHQNEIKSMAQSFGSKLAGAESEKSRALAVAEGLKGDLAKTQGDLDKARAIMNAKKQLAGQIAANFAKSGLKGAVDGGTGEVTLDFGEEYFDTGSTILKPKMKMALDKFIPIYTRSIFTDPKIASKIASVEIVGFASSTYKGKYVNPKSTNPTDKAAIEYNLKLSFGRANQIFSHVLNKNTLSKSEQERLLGLIKVVGRGYLPEGTNPSDIPTNISEGDFCKRFNCKKAQKVIVKFNMKD